jgi:site-specific DNA-methyltransferase (adenine-specific)
VPCRVLDPFAGSGRTLIAAAKLGCEATGIELNPEYVEMAREQIAAALRPSTARTTKPIPAPLFAQEPDPESAPAELF